MAPVLVEYWDKIGVTTRIKALESASFLYTFNKKEYSSITLTSAAGDFPILGTSTISQPGPENAWNISNWEDPTMREYVEAAYKTTDPSERDEAITNTQLRFLGQLPGIMLPALILYRPWWPWVKNYWGENHPGHICSSPIYATI